MLFYFYLNKNKNLYKNVHKIVFPIGGATPILKYRAIFSTKINICFILK